MNNTINYSGNENPLNQPQIPYYFDTSPNINTFPNQETSPKHDNLISNQISYETNMTTLGSNQIDKFKLQIIEKDKIIIDLKQKEKDLNKQISKLNLHLNEKDDQIFRLEDKIQELLQTLKSTEFQNEIKFNKFSENEKNFNLKINDIIIENENLKKQIQNLTAVIEANESSMKNLYIEKQKKDEDIKNLIEELKKKDNMIDINYNKKQILINENKQLPSLKGKIDDLEKIILELKDEIVGLRDINDKLLEEKNELNSQLNKKEEEIMKNRIYEQSLINLNNKNILLNKEIQKKGNDIQSLDDKYLSLMNNNETFIHLITNELGNFLNYLESINMNNLTSLNNTTFKIPINNLPNFEHTKLDDNFMLKYEILTKCILQIEEKITDMLNICKTSVNKINHDLNILEEKNQNIINEKNEIKKELFSLKNKITDITQDNNDKNLNMQKKVNELTEAQNINQALKKDNEDLIYKNSVLDKEYQRLINDIDNKLIQFPLRPLDDLDESNFLINNKNFAKENFNNMTTLSTNKIIHKIDSLIYLNKELNKELSEMIRNNKTMNQKNIDLNNENLLLKDKIRSYEESIQTEINNYKTRKENELNETKEVLFKKVKSLNNILEQGNKLIKSYELEVAELKNKNSKLEFNLKMLTQSHQELENIVNLKDDGLKEQIEIKENDYQNLIKEIQLKDLQIKSLEKLLEQYQGEKNEDINNEEFKEEDSIVSFAKDNIREMQLNKLINNFDEINTQNNDEENEDFNNNINNTNQREPGKIIFNKK
jgi:hypothetical protein